MTGNELGSVNHICGDIIIIINNNLFALGDINYHRRLDVNVGTVEVMLKRVEAI